MPTDLETLLAQLKQAAYVVRPDREKIAPDILDGIRAFGADAVEPLVAMLTETMTTNWEKIVADNEAGIVPDKDEPWDFSDVYIVDLLSQLPISAEAVHTLLHLATQYEDDEWFSEEIGRELWQAGEVVIDPCLTCLRDRSIAEYPRNVAAGILENLAKGRPELRDRIADGLVEVMSSVTREDETWAEWSNNAFMLGALGPTRAERYIPFVRQMFAQDRVDVMVTGMDWVLDEIQGIDPMIRHKDKFDQPLDEGELIDRLSRAAAFFEAANNRTSPGEYPDPVVPPPPPPPMLSVGGWHTVTAPKRPGRNDPCWCGSGKKYKKCHLREDEEKDRLGK